MSEWKAKADDINAEIEASQKECRNYNSELFRLRAAYDESVEQLDVVKRENKNLADEIRDLLDQLGDGGRSIHELDKQRRRLEVEKEELQVNRILFVSGWSKLILFVLFLGCSGGG